MYKQLQPYISWKSEQGAVKSTSSDSDNV